MKLITVNIPDNVDLDTKDTIRFFAAKLYESGKLSLGQAAEVAGLSKVTFAELLGDYAVSLINYSIEDVRKDAAAI